VNRATGMILRILLVFPHIDECTWFVAIELSLHLFDRTFSDLLPGLFDEFQKSWIVLHVSP
jgi:hypothetical protein